MKINARKAVFEFLSIIVAVVLAMALSEWRQDHNNRKLAEESYERILDEIENNLNELKRDSARVAKDIEFIVNWLTDVYNKKEPQDFDVNYNFSFLNNSALSVAEINRSLSFLPQEKLMRISEIYATQEFYAAKGPQVFDEMSQLTSLSYERQPQEFVNQVKRFRFQLGLVLGTMKAYIEEAEDLLELEESR